MFRILAIVSMSAVLASAGTYVSCSDEKADDTRSVALAVAGHLSGAVFTTTSDGSRVNANLYPAMDDVYLDGGPGPNAPSQAAGLPEGDYYFQVTDPSGKDLLSTDHISCRRVHVSADGVIDEVYAGTNYTYVNKDKEWVSVACQHEQGVDQDHSDLGAITVRLFPYDQTPNKGGVYKAWMTRTGDYAGDPQFVPSDKKDAVNGESWQPANVHGFVPAYSKTDNYKVERKGPPCDAPVVLVDKFHDANMNAVQDTGEPNIGGWGMTIAFPGGSSNLVCTPESVTGEVGDWGVTEDTPAGTMQTASYLDGQLLTSYPNASPTVLFTVASECGGEVHEVDFGNVGLGEVTACKVYDRNADGVADDGEPGVVGWKMSLTGTDVTGGAVDMTLDGSDVAGTVVEHEFTNVCTGATAFNTKGYWHNKNGLAEITGDDVTLVNGMAPYAGPSTYFGAGDEPFDGLFTDGTPVAASKGVLGDTIAGAGTWQAEMSQFLVDANANGDPREQLAQQLLAFVMNTQHRLDGMGAAVVMPDGSFETAGAIVDQAVDAWNGGTDAERNAMAQMLDGFNNDNAVEFVHAEPCTVEYP